MSETQQTPSIAARVRPIAAGAAVVAVHFLKNSAVFALAEETVLLTDGETEQRVAAHDGAILSVACDGVRFITGGDDGKVTVTAADGTTQIVAADAKRRWIDQVALGPDGAFAWSAGKTVFARTGKGEAKSLDIPSSAGGLAFAPKGVRLAIAHYNGATLWFPNVIAGTELLEWKGSHLGVQWSPDGKYIVTDMQEAMLHGWRLADRRNMRMSGYAARVRSYGWTTGGRWLATAGSDQLILWPFHSKDGPMGKEPKMLAPWSTRLVVLACHPKQEVVACGYVNGLILLVRIEDGAEILVRPPGTSPVTALAFSADGRQLAFGTESGEAGIAPLGA